MWIKSEVGKNINSDEVCSFHISQLTRGEFAVTATYRDSQYCQVAMFSHKEDAQKFLDRMMGIVGGKIWKIDRTDWHYTSHKKDHKETRHGGS